MGHGGELTVDALTAVKVAVFGCARAFMVMKGGRCFKHCVVED